MTETLNKPAATPADGFTRATLVLADGTMFEGHGVRRGRDRR